MNKIDHENIKTGDEVQIDDSPNWWEVVAYKPGKGVIKLSRGDRKDYKYCSIPITLVTAHRPAKLKAIAALEQEKGARPFADGEKNYYGWFNYSDNSIHITALRWLDLDERVYFDTEENALSAYTKHAKDLWGVE